MDASSLATLKRTVVFIIGIAELGAARLATKRNVEVFMVGKGRWITWVGIKVSDRGWGLEGVKPVAGRCSGSALQMGIYKCMRGID